MGQRLLLFGHHQVIAEHLQALEQHVGAMRNHLGPPPGFCNRGTHQTEVFGVLVGPQKEHAVAMFDLVLVPLLPGQDRTEGPLRIGGGQDSLVPGVGALRGADKPLMILGPPQAQSKQFVLLFQHQLRPTAFQGQSPQLVAPFGHGILGGVEHKRAVGRPFEAGDPLGQGSGSLPGSEVFAVEGVLAEARDVRAVEKCGAGIAGLKATESEERMALSQEVQIQQNLLRGLGIRSPVWRHLAPAMNGILPALFGPGVVIISPAPKRNGEVGLLDAPQHFLVEQLTKGLGLHGAGFHVGVFRFQVANHLRVGFFAEPEPGVID